MEEEQRAQCLKILQDLFKLKDSVPFREPVPWKEMGLTDYPLVVKRPMDLGTIERNIEDKLYSSPSDFASDVRLIWGNCMVYNQESSPLYTQAKRLQSYFEQKFRTVTGNEETTEFSNDEKSKFSQNLYKLQGRELATVVTTLYEKCPGCIQKISVNEIDLNLDKIDPITYHQVKTYVDSCISEAEKRLRPSDAGPVEKKPRIK